MDPKNSIVNVDSSRRQSEENLKAYRHSQLIPESKYSGSRPAANSADQKISFLGRGSSA